MAPSDPSSSSSASLSPAQMLQSAFGFPTFREGQEAVVTKLLAGRSVLAVFPTGAGKSLCYQLPALMMDGITLVISPLIALMKDQIDFLVGRGIAAARIDSSVGMEEGRQVYRDLNAGRLKLLYVAPERLANERFLQTLRRLKLSMLAVDEAHCISEWGHNFRPDYMKIAAMAQSLAIPRVLALTATATPSVARDIAAAFKIADEDVVQTGFYRPNLSLHVAAGRGSDRDELLLNRLRSRPRGPTVVYVTLQRTAENVARQLESAGLPARAYHAGMKDEDRHAVQDWFMSASGDGGHMTADPIVVATIAFGMGIDKSDIRYVYHYNLPKSLENYAQEIGRAGRDGRPSVCEMLAAAEDLIVLGNFTFGDTPTPEAVAGLLHFLLSGRSAGEVFDISSYDLSGRFDVRPLVVDTLLTYLELDGLIQSTGPFYTEYKFQPLKSSAEMLAPFDEGRRQFLRKILSHARKAKTWFWLGLEEVVTATGEPRERIVAALNFLEQQGGLTLQVGGARHGYRVCNADFNLKEMEERLIGRFLSREKRDTERLQQVVDFAGHAGCYPRRLLTYFGQDLPADCGHCGWCLGIRPDPLPPAQRRPLDADDKSALRTLIAQRHVPLATPRQLARFLCGINSPAVTRAKLQKERMFGALASVPFAEVLRWAENALQAASTG
jgi:ATP-dependent DNA helicase RecQ